ncbi:hypothetical protein NBRC10512_001503 [Rhodotorula toruloides]|uniref:RHTO0S07e08680g1_1 n=2 Tax=Rhodotorula toruloides TaxID=5286 RepID=A0A061B013_RHOTO|nr:nucleus protein [Rhodotorula toruloides NP11]EMS25311.1 nucleus protein [Rhodotorula toruloides NP11]CDR43134.1 RHTO0S07e08680g1_1 [Rhodotorula toruloides]
MAPLKVLVTGPAHSLDAYFTKLATLQAKHAFDLVLSLDLFSHLEPASRDSQLERLVRGEYSVPVQVYAAHGRDPLPPQVKQRVDKGDEVCANLNFLPKAGLLTLASGLRIATLSGTSPSSDSGSPITDAELSSLIASLTPPSSAPGSSLPPPPPKPIDLLLTHLCPSSLPLLSSKPLTPSDPSTPFAPELDDLAKRARARYHFFDAPGVFWEREALEWPVEEGVSAEKSYCRALGLGAMGNKTKERWFYAFSITPSISPSPPTSSTPSPFHTSLRSGTLSLASSLSGSNGPRGLKRPAGVTEEDVNEMGVPNWIFEGVGGKNGAGGEGRERKKGKGPPPDHYTCRICDQKGHWIQDCPEKEARDAERAASRAHKGPAKPISPDECWFCLSNPKVTKHLIASIGNEVYLTLPKGQVTSTDSSPVPGGGHVLLIPIAHYPTLRSIPADLAPPILEEIELYKQALKKCYKSFGAEMVAFEVARSAGKGGHAHVQICPIPSSLASEAESTFLTQGAKFNYDFEEIAEPSTFHARAEQDGKGTEYFKVDLPDGKSLVHWLKPGTPFSLQFGRETLALLLHAPDRADWKRCAKPDDEEKKDGQRFKNLAFKAFDPST